VNYSDTQLTSSGVFMHHTRIRPEGGGSSEPNKPPPLNPPLIYLLTWLRVRS